MDLVSEQVVPKLEGPLSSNQHHPLCIGHDRGKTIVEDMVYIKFNEILHINKA
ncbi:hypothetical protein B296_00051082 [Ensete ventricosum]|uniref:Uncharacterized protein n=1 Tax=Ensete ventricosum TaxID=4639 RepID=A0A426YID2_ENSVE|nr:hypothetical protein B296_00051082 [Ensete ventricosum]